MRPPTTITISGGDYLLSGIWLSPEDIESLHAHHRRELLNAAKRRDDASVEHHTAWVRVIVAANQQRADWRRASGAVWLGERRDAA